MPVQLVEETERLVYAADESKFYYRRITTARRARVIKSHTKRGVTDWGAVTSDLLAWSITGWDNVCSGGSPIPYDQALVARLPEEVTLAILDLSHAADGEAAEKN